MYSLSIVRSGELTSEESIIQEAHDIGWDVDMLDRIVPNGFIKCALNESFGIEYMSPKLYASSGLSESEFIRRFHNSLLEAVTEEDRAEFVEAVSNGRQSGETFSCDVSVYHGYANARRETHIIGRVQEDKNGVPWLYTLVLLTGQPVMGDGSVQDDQSRTVVFDYDMNEDRLVVHFPVQQTQSGAPAELELDNWLAVLDGLPDKISAASASKVHAMARDLRHHPAPGFLDVKCNLRGSEGLRWYHINYTCDADENGDTIVVHGYAQDANDQMGSARWWRQQAEIDHLTGLLNRNAVEQNINLSMRTHGAGMMFMIDLDGFKLINDELGHLAGDELLRDVAEVLERNFREGDVLGRYGGDEFVAFVPILDFDPDAMAQRRASQIISQVMTIEAGGGRHVGCSVGVAISRDRDATFYDLLEIADGAMYASKEAGKGTYTIVNCD